MGQRLQSSLDPTFDDNRPTLKHTPVKIHPAVTAHSLEQTPELEVQTKNDFAQVSQSAQALVTSKPTIKKHKKTLLLEFLGITATLAILAFFAFSHTAPAIQPLHIKSVRISSNVAPPPTTINYSLPARLEIPALKVNAAVSYLGLTPAGSMAAPTNIVSVGWYKYGALPGNTGSAVIVGHLDGLEGQPGVFSNLDKLQNGDDLTVIDSNGRSTTFVVENVQAYSQNETLSAVFNSSSGSHLNLITCTGGWDAGEHRYLQRLVVFANKV